MSDPTEAQAPTEASTATPTGPSAGTMLRTAREAAGIHVSALAVALKVSVKKLEALESDDLAQLPDAVFARALAASVCRTLKIDAEPVLQRLPQLHVPSMPAGNTGQTVRLDNHRGLRLSSSFGLPKPVLMVTAALLIGAVVVMVLPTLRGAAERTASGDLASPSATLAPAPAVVQVPVVPLPAVATSASGPALAPVAPASTGNLSAAPAPAASTPAAAAEPAAIAAFTARDKAWVQVLGSDGVVHLRKTLDAGETVRINGALPLSVVIGRADAIGVLVRGKPYDLTPVAKDNVARFQIK